MKYLLILFLLLDELKGYWDVFKSLNLDSAESPISARIGIIFKDLIF